MIDLHTLYDIIDESTKTIEICIPDQDYYARRDDWTRTDLTYICPYALLQKLAEKVEEQKRELEGTRLGNFD